MGLQFISCHPLTRRQLAPPLRPFSIEWTEVVNGAGSLNGKITLPQDTQAAAQVLTATTPEESAIYIKDSTYGWLSGYVVVEREWDRSSRTIAFTAVEWRSWLYSVFLGPKVDLTADNVYSWTAKDQLQIAREIVAFAIAGGTADGRPSITIGTEVSGKLRDLNVKGLNFKYAGELIDSMASRSTGFEWDLLTYADTVDGLPRLKLGLWFPQRGSLVPGFMMKRTPKGGNFTLDGSIKESTTERRTRVWTTGSTETLPFAQDSDPALATGYVLLRESTRSYSTVVDRTTLASHARAERAFYSPKVGFLSGTIPTSKQALGSYRAGDRCRLVYQDDVYDIDSPAVRIVQRKVTLSTTSGSGKIAVTLDLSDATLPEADSGGAV